MGDYGEYLNTNHWKSKRQERLSSLPHCRICKSEKKLNIHHKFYKDKKGKSTLYNERTVDLITLCASCHRLWHLYCHNRLDKKGRPNISKKIMGIRELLELGAEKPWAFRMAGLDLWVTVRNKYKKHVETIR